jgi:hypothetical protein
MSSPPQLPHLPTHDSPTGAMFGTDSEQPAPPEKDDVHEPVTRQTSGQADGPVLAPINTSLPSQLQQPVVSPEVAKQVSDVLSSEVGFSGPHAARPLAANNQLDRHLHATESTEAEHCFHQGIRSFP